MLKNYFSISILLIISIILISCNSKDKVDESHVKYNPSDVQLRVELTDRASYVYRCTFEDYMKYHFANDAQGLDIARKYMKIDEMASYKYAIIGHHGSNNTDKLSMIMLLVIIAMFGAIVFLLILYFNG